MGVVFNHHWPKRSHLRTLQGLVKDNSNASATRALEVVTEIVWERAHTRAGADTRAAFLVRAREILLNLGGMTKRRVLKGPERKEMVLHSDS